MKTTVTAILQNYQPKFHQVVSFHAEKDQLVLMDFTKDNEALSEELVNNTQLFANYIALKLQSANAKFGIGGYNEYRELYSRSRVFDPEPGEEPRRLHLGIDIWGKPYTAVMSPWDGIVHSFAFNNRFGDYGATLVLSHSIEEVSFHTLYGHLSLNSIKNFREGENVRRGDVIGEFGIPMENGQWPPHLHFQVIIDMEVPIAIGRRGDYPGVCSLSEKERFLDNCPDPDLVLGMMKYVL
ncbi:MAG TPA: peptidoglycan DD-metalloendopeptidase family protein [Chitinophagaceae bacterium]|jgi:peptidoglycan LD-endopeptidase LytH|nr:peptidoglycan DD-metalloendopeptidase family protein [Chitinophagaceae bacterium]